MKDITLMSIRDLTKKTGLTSRTLRFYEEMGLIAPERISENSLRCYHQADIDKIKRIKELKKLFGFSLEEIKLIVEIEGCCCSRHKRIYESLTGSKEKLAMLGKGHKVLSELRAVAGKRKKSIENLIMELDKKLDFIKKELSAIQKNHINRGGGKNEKVVN